MGKLILLRHGESQWNLENRFTGWVDVPLSSKGIEETKTAANILANSGIEFTHTHTSYLERAIHTHFLVLQHMKLLWLPVDRSWRWNERHYGALQGLNKSEMAQKYGEDQVLQWRRSFKVRPPALSANDEQSPLLDPKYKNIVELPLGESLEDTVLRVSPVISKVKDAASNKNILVVAHGNSIRATVMQLLGWSPEKIQSWNIPTCVPYVIPITSQGAEEGYFLGDEKQIQSAIAAVKSQGKSTTK